MKYIIKSPNFDISASQDLKKKEDEKRVRKWKQMTGMKWTGRQPAARNNLTFWFFQFQIKREEP